MLFNLALRSGKRVGLCGLGDGDPVAFPTLAGLGVLVRVHLNMAMSLDGRVAGPQGQPLPLSSEEDTERVHAHRARSDAILVGVNTVLNDDPRLTARGDPPPDKAPVRVVLDTNARTPEDARVLDDEAPTWLLTGSSMSVPEGARGIPVGDPITPKNALEALRAEGVVHVLLEGGPTVAASFLREGLVDRFTLYIAPVILGRGPSLPEALSGIQVPLSPRSRAPLGEGVLVAYEVP